MATSDRAPRPATPAGQDPSRAGERAADPAGWALPEATRHALADVVAARRDIRRFRPDPVPEPLLRRVLEQAHRAPSVGFMQPWRFVVVRSPARRAAMRALAERERLAQADRFDDRARQFLDQKVEGVLEAPVGLAVCVDHGPPDEEILGRGTIPETDVQSTACAIQNLWLTARAEGLGVGWVSFYRPPDLAALLGLPERVEPLAWLCLGWPDERPVRPGLQSAGWATRMPLELAVHDEGWDPAVAERTAAWRTRHGGGRRRTSASEADDGALCTAVDAGAGRHCASRGSAEGPAGLPGPLAAVVADVPEAVPEAAIAVRDRADRLARPAGSLGGLEEALERLAASTGAVPGPELRPAVLVCCADHGHAARGSSLFGPEVSAQVAAAAGRGHSAVGVLAAELGAPLLVADLGLLGEPAGPGLVRAARVRAGTADACTSEAMSHAEVLEAVAAGGRLADEVLDLALAAGAGTPLLLPGEIGIGNTATAAMLLGALTGLPPERSVGRGTGLDAEGLHRKRGLVGAALERHAGPLAALTADPAAHALEALRRLGGLELAALVGAMLRAAARRAPVLLDGMAVGVCALVACRLAPGLREHLLAAHRSAEPAHGAVLEELGLQPLLDLRLRLGEASGAALAVPLLRAAVSVHHRMATFADAGIDLRAGGTGADASSSRGDRI